MCINSFTTVLAIDKTAVDATKDQVVDPDYAHYLYVVGKAACRLRNPTGPVFTMGVQEVSSSKFQQDLRSLPDKTTTQCDIETGAMI